MATLDATRPPRPCLILFVVETHPHGVVGPRLTAGGQAESDPWRTSYLTNDDHVITVSVFAALSAKAPRTGREARRLARGTGPSIETPKGPPMHAPSARTEPKHPTRSHHRHRRPPEISHLGARRDASEHARRDHQRTRRPHRAATSCASLKCSTAPSPSCSAS